LFYNIGKRSQFLATTLSKVLKWQTEFGKKCKIMVTGAELWQLAQSLKPNMSSKISAQFVMKSKLNAR
jgi:hypothetical protein